MKTNLTISALSMALAFGLIACDKNQDVVVAPKTTASAKGARTTATSYPTSVTVGSNFYERYKTLSVLANSDPNPHAIWLQNGWYSLVLGKDGSLSIWCLFTKQRTLAASNGLTSAANKISPNDPALKMDNQTVSAFMSVYAGGGVDSGGGVPYIPMGTAGSLRTKSYPRFWQWHFSKAGLSNYIQVEQAQYYPSTGFGTAIMNGYSLSLYAASTQTAQQLFLTTTGKLQILDAAGQVLWEI